MLNECFICKTNNIVLVRVCHVDKVGMSWSSTLHRTTMPGSRPRSKTAQDMSGLSGFSARVELFEFFERFVLKTRLNPSSLAYKTAQKPLISCCDFITVSQAKFELFLSGF